MRRSNLSVLALILSILLICLPWHGLAADGLSQSCGKITYATNPNYPPFGWNNGKGGYDGAAVALLRKVAPPGVHLVPLELPWRRAQEMARSGSIDLLLAIRPTEEREKYLLFTSHRAFANPIVVFTRHDPSFPYGQWSDLKGRLGGVSIGDSFGHGFDNYLKTELTVEEAPSAENNFRKLAFGRIDYFVSGYYFSMAILKGGPLESLIEARQPPVTDGDIGFAFSRKSACSGLAVDMSARLAELDQAGVPERLVKEAVAEYVALQRRDARSE